MSEINFEFLLGFVADLVQQQTGNIVSEKQRPMLEARLKNRMLKLSFESPKQYYDHLKNDFINETKELITLFTTHHTSFFRELVHYDFIRDHLPLLSKIIKEEGRKTLKIWSAACSKGHEAYSLAFMLNHLSKENSLDITFEILGTDIDQSCVQTANNGVYHISELKTIPIKYLETCFDKGKGDIADYMRVKKELKAKCVFKPFNLVLDDFNNLGQKFDIILCRNVFIYFDHKTIQNILKKMTPCLNKNGILITGVSEIFPKENFSLVTVGPSIYSSVEIQNLINPNNKSTRPIEQIQTQKDFVKEKSKEEAPVEVLKSISPIKVFCIDDSPIILKLFEKIFQGPSYKIVGTAGNGEEAHQKLQHIQADIVTLDVHMPVMDGIEYLKKYFNNKHPPVIMATSISREENGMALKALELGASDYVEKPSLNNMVEAKEEILNKIKMALDNKKPVSDRSIHSGHLFDQAIKRSFSIHSPENARIIYISQTVEDSKIPTFLNQFSKEGVKILCLANTIPSHCEKNFGHFDTIISPQCSSLKSNFFRAIEHCKGKNTVFILENNIEKEFEDAILYFLKNNKAKLIVNEKNIRNLNEKSVLFPFATMETSFENMCLQFFNETKKAA